MPNNSGYVDYTNLEEYYLDTSVATGNTKPNVSPDPDYIPSYYDSILCPPASLTPTPTPTPTITPTPSIKGIFGRYNVNIYASMLNLSSLNESVNIYYKIDSGLWNKVGNVGDVACKNFQSISVNGGSTLAFAMLTGSTSTYDPGLGVGSDIDVNFLASNASNCLIGKSDTYLYCGIANPYSQVILQNTDISLGAFVDTTSSEVWQLVPCKINGTQRIAPTPSASPGEYFSGVVNIAYTSEDVCTNNYNAVSITTTGSDTLFCTSTQFFSYYFSSIPADTYYITYGNYVATIVTDGSSSFAVVTNTCALCPSIPVSVSVTPTPTPSVSVGSPVVINSFGTTPFSCLFPNDYIGYYVNLNTSVSDDTIYNFSIVLQDPKGNIINTNNIPVLIPAGSTTNTIGANPCIGGGLYTGGNIAYSVCITDIISGSTTIVNPFGYCDGPDVTPSPTPSITPTITKTPSVTPSTPVSPSVTPTVTKTPTPTPSVPSNFTITNIGSGAFNISNVVRLEAVIDVFYSTKSGTFPVTDGNSLTGALLYNVTTPIRVTVSDYVGGLGLTLYKNGILQQCLSVSGNGNYTFSLVSFTTSDTMTIKVEKAC